jgi:hypothetical protein
VNQQDEEKKKTHYLKKIKYLPSTYILEEIVEESCWRRRRRVVRYLYNDPTNRVKYYYFWMDFKT